MEEPTNKKIAPVTLPLRCGSCWHFKTMKSKKYSKTCIELGIVEQSPPCKYYQNNPTTLSINGKIGQAYAELMQMVPDGKLSTLASLAAAERKTRKQGLHFGQVVYFRQMPGDYISNYVKARVIQATPENVFVEGHKSSIKAMLLRGSVYNEEEWRIKKRALIKQKRFDDPRRNDYNKVKPPTAGDSIPELDRIIQEVENSERKPRNPTNIRTTSLVRLIGGESDTITIIGKKNPKAE